MTDTLDALLAAVLADPDNDTVRLAFADALDEAAERTGEPVPVPRAEFVRVQVEIARRWPEVVTPFGSGPGMTCRDVPDYNALRERADELLAGPKPAIFSQEVVWFNSGDGTETWRLLFRPVWRRGFVESVACSAADFLRHADALLAAHPVREVTLTTWPRRLYNSDFSRVQLGGRRRRHPAPPMESDADEPYAMARLLHEEFPGVETWHLTPPSLPRHPTTG